MSKLSDLDLFFLYQVEKGFHAKDLHEKGQEYRDRINHEAKIITSMGFAGYFLVVQDFIQWCHQNDVYVGPGRGSSSGSLACYSLGITQLDPIEWGLFFERFLNPGRVGSFPDIDVDFEKRYRDRVVDYLAERWGHEKVAHIGTFMKSKANGSVRMIARTLGQDFAMGTKICDMLMDPIQGKPVPLKDSVAQNKDLQSYMNNPDSIEGDILTSSLKVEDLISSSGVHASGVIIANDAIYNRVPLLKNKDGKPTAQWDMHDVEKAGLIKYDILGVKVLEIVHRAVEQIEKVHGKHIDVYSLEPTDEKIFESLSNGNTIGVFQLEGSDGIKELTMQIQPKNKFDNAAVTAIYRPGPLASPYKKTYLEIRAGRQEPVYAAPGLEPILGETDGFLIYQEQAIAIARDICGYSLVEADKFRKAIGKKDEALMNEISKTFIEKWVEHGHPRQVGEDVLQSIKEFSAYGFVKAHAAAYSIMSYWTAYLKYYYPTEFMTASLTAEEDSKSDVIKGITECRRLGIEILPPSVNSSGLTFESDGQNVIRFGLGSIKNMSAEISKVIKDRNENGPYASFFDFVRRTEEVVEKKNLETLIDSGALDVLGSSRRAMNVAMEKFWEYKKKVKAYNAKMKTYEGRKAKYNQRIVDIGLGKRTPKGKKLAPLSLPPKPEIPEFPVIREMEEYSQIELQQKEHDLLGYFVTSHPIDLIKNTGMANGLLKIEQMSELPDKTKVTFVAAIVESKKKTTRKKTTMANIKLEDKTGTISGTVFPRTYTQVESLLKSIKPVMVNGVVEITTSEDERVASVKITSLKEIPIKVTERHDTFNMSQLSKVIAIANHYKAGNERIRLRFESEETALNIRFNISRSSNFYKEIDSL